MIPWFDPPVLSLGPLDIDLPSWLGLAGALVAMALVHRRARKAGLSARRAVDGLFLIVACGLLFGHTFDVLLYRWGELQMDWRLILPWSGGYSSLGAAVGLVVAVLAFFRAPGTGLRWDYLDHTVIALLLGLGILRTGCFLGHHHAGRLSDFILAVAYPGGARHDLGLEEALLVFGLYAVLFLLDRHVRRPRPGLLCGAAMLGYGAGRFALEFLRGRDIELLGRHSDARYAGLTLVQYGALLLAIAGVGILGLRGRSRDGADRDV